MRFVECLSWFDVILCFLAVHKANCGSLKEVQDWVYDDLASTSNWLQQRDPKVSYFFHILVGLNTAEIHSDRALITISFIDLIVKVVFCSLNPRSSSSQLLKVSWSALRILLSVSKTIRSVEEVLYMSAL